MPVEYADGSFGASVIRDAGERGSEPMADLKWACPHCDAGPAAGHTSTDLLLTCDRCGFAFPRPAEVAAGTKWREMLALAETSTEKWVDICADRYSILRALGVGAQGRIFLAHHRHLDQLCVIKVLNAPDDEWKEVAVARLRSEAHAGASVNHPNVARVLDCDCVRGTWYFAMEYVDGVNLRKVLLEKNRMKPEQVVEIMGRYELAYNYHTIRLWIMGKLYISSSNNLNGFNNSVGIAL